MNQPELGKKLAEIRKEKGITQEELVDMCNVTVRTIQRIEAGEVTPRPSTLKLILEAMDADFHAFKNNDQSGINPKDSFFKNWSDWILITESALYNDDEKKSSILRSSWIAGIIYFILGFFEAFLEYQIQVSSLPGQAVYVGVKLLAIVTFVFFLRGFIIIGRRYANSLLVLSSYLYLFAVVLNYSADSLLLIAGFDEIEALLVGQSVLYGASSILFGLGLMRNQNTLGRLANYSGLLEIIAGVTFLSVVFFLVGLILQIPAVLFEIYLIFKYAESLKRPDSAH